MSNMILILLIVAVYLKWILIILLFPSQICWRIYQENKSRIFCKILAVPYWFWEIHLMRGGWERYMLFQVSVFPSCHLRKKIYQLLGAQIDSNVVVHFKTEIRGVRKLILGKGTIIGDNAILDARNGLIMGHNVNLSSNVSIYTEQHDHRDPKFGCSQTENKTVRIGDRAWIGSNVIILPGVQVGEGAVCCAGCVVTKDVEPFTVVAGVPAKKVNERPRNLTYEFNGKSIRFY